MFVVKDNLYPCDSSSGIIKNFNNYLFSNHTVGSVYFETVLFNQEKLAFMYISFSIELNVFGGIEKGSKHYVVPINLYIHTRDFKRLLVEVIYLLFIAYYFSKKAKGIFTIIAIDLERDFNEDP